MLLKCIDNKVFTRVDNINLKIVIFGFKVALGCFTLNHPHDNAATNSETEPEDSSAANSAIKSVLPEFS